MQSVVDFNLPSKLHLTGGFNWFMDLEIKHPLLSTLTGDANQYERKRDWIVDVGGGGEFYGSGDGDLCGDDEECKGAARVFTDSSRPPHHHHPIIISLSLYSSSITNPTQATTMAESMKLFMTRSSAQPSSFTRKQPPFLLLLAAAVIGGGGC